MEPIKRQVNRDKVMERRLVYISIMVQTILTASVLLFCFIQLHDNRELAEGDRSVYYNLITACLAYWFPSPISGYAGLDINKPTRSSRGRSTDYKNRQ